MKKKLIDAEELKKILLSERYKTVTGSHVIHISDYELINEINSMPDESKDLDINTFKDLINSKSHIRISDTKKLYPEWYINKDEFLNYVENLCLSRTITIPKQTDALRVLDEQNDKFVESVCKRIRRDWDIIFPKTKSGFMEVARKYVRAIHNQLREELKGGEDERNEKSKL